MFVLVDMEEMSDSSANQQQNDRQKSSRCQRGGKVAKSKVNFSQIIFLWNCNIDCWFQGKKMSRVKAAGLGWEEKCQNLLDTLIRSEESATFRTPLENVNYLQAIEQPMDLQTIGEQLQTGKYATPSEFAKDVRLIFENVKKFIFVTDLSTTMKLWELFEKHFKCILASYETRKATTGRKCKLFQFNWTFLNLRFFVGKSASLHSKATKSKKGKSLALTNSFDLGKRRVRRRNISDDEEEDEKIKKEEIPVVILESSSDEGFVFSV